VERKKVKDVSRLNQVIKFIFDNIGNETSVRNIKNNLETAGIKISPSDIDSFIDGLLDAFVLYRANRYDVKGKNILKTNPKYYLVDTGFRSAVLGTEGDIGHLLENIVYFELLRRNNKVYVGKVGGTDGTKTREIDFVAENNNGKEYYQVAETVRDKKTLERELASLNAVRDHNPKYLLTMDYSPTQTFNGIKQINVLDWLLGEV
jgi:predicted AAA+ superfamily ATPase